MPSLHYPNDLCSKSRRELFCRCGPNRGKGIFSVHACSCSDLLSYRFLIMQKQSMEQSGRESFSNLGQKKCIQSATSLAHTLNQAWSLHCPLCLRVFWTLYVSQEQCTGHTRVKWITHNDSCCRLFLCQRVLLSGRVTINFANSFCARSGPI